MSYYLHPIYGLPYPSPPPPYPYISPPPPPPSPSLPPPPSSPSPPPRSPPPATPPSPPPPSHPPASPPCLPPSPPISPVLPPSPYAPPSPPSSDNHKVIVAVCASLGGLFFLAFVTAALFCFAKKKKKRMAAETEVVDVEDHVRVQEAIIPGPCGEQVVVMSIDEDIHVTERINKAELVESSHGRHSPESHHHSHDASACSPPSSRHRRHHLEHKG